jgi:hypothetical protein
LTVGGFSRMLVTPVHAAADVERHCGTNLCGPVSGQESSCDTPVPTCRIPLRRGQGAVGGEVRAAVRLLAELRRRAGAAVSVPGFRNLGSLTHSLSRRQLARFPSKRLISKIQLSSEFRVLDSPHGPFPCSPANDVRVLFEDVCQLSSLLPPTLHTECDNQPAHCGSRSVSTSQTHVGHINIQNFAHQVNENP